MNIAFHSDKMFYCRGKKKNKNRSFYYVKGFLGHCNSFSDMFNSVAGYMIHDIVLYMRKHFAHIPGRSIDDRDIIHFAKNESFICIDEGQKDHSLITLVGYRPMFFIINSQKMVMLKSCIHYIMYLLPFKKGQVA